MSDPRIEDLTYEIYEEQERVLLEIRDFMTDVRVFENKVSNLQGGYFLCLVFLSHCGDIKSSFLQALAPYQHIPL